jgi:hypothetical protein
MDDIYKSALFILPSDVAQQCHFRQSMDDEAQTGVPAQQLKHFQRIHSGGKIN